MYVLVSATILPPARSRKRKLSGYDCELTHRQASHGRRHNWSVLHEQHCRSPPTPKHTSFHPGRPLIQFATAVKWTKPERLHSEAGCACLLSLK